ncbi:MAG: FG-GAP-like repeat-containing protein [Gammaproteobacteria bacterium]|nr:FG-GAP-like repeat-containing protein [Gammaproteobacteria bacterium]
MKKLHIFGLGLVLSIGAAHADEMSFPKLMPVAIPGAPSLSEPLLVMAGDVPVLTEKHGLAAPALWDWDGDGRRDLLVGEFETNSSDFPMGVEGSTIRVYLNVGTDSQPRFTEEFEWARDTEGGIMEVPQWCCIGFTPMFYDLDDDGYKDMITGQYHPGEVTWFRGSAEGFLPGHKLPQEGDPAADANPAFDAERVKYDPSFQPYPGEPGDIGTFEYWVYSSATFGDLDDDGDYDLIVGGSGGLRVSENVGGPKSPSFGVRKLLLDVNGQPLQTRSYTQSEVQYMQTGMRMAPSGDGKPNPLAVDWDQDGVLDLLVTDSYRASNSRAVSFFRGVKTPDGHRFEPGIDLLPAEGGGKAIPGSGQRVYVDDWNGDGVNDLIIGASVATVNGGEFSDELSWEWEDVNKVESAGKDPGLYPPRPRPTLESQRAMYQEIAADRAAEGVTIEVPTDDELMQQLPMQQEWWDKDIGRLYDAGKEHWLTMRHQGRVYVMLGSRGAQQDAMIASNAPENRETAIDSEVRTADSETDDVALSPVSIRVEPLTVLETGRSVDIEVQLDMMDGWYVYAPTGRNVGQGMKETSVIFSLPDGLTGAGAVRMPPYGFKGSYDIFSGKGVTWAKPIEAIAGTLPGLYEVNAEVTYQTCKDDICLLPQTETVVARVLVQ